ncbi:MAG: hypothetical protein UR60_C0017G0020 [Candidatus Moranbacteria bacterium GW2011_GWF2_34_56]|nr:MAG: hypothetical protein UR60_C0017G0020 [Candidatus Moranbacteria bacterium GW2011_GWF2_34_56]
MAISNEMCPLSVASIQVQLQWTLGGLSELISVPKKQLKKAFKIVSTPKLEATIMKRGGLVRKTFLYGFASYIIKNKNKERKILEPHPEVQKVYKKIKEWLEKVDPPHERTFGFVKDRNCKKATETLSALFRGGHHVAFDIADAFPNITEEMIKEALLRLEIEVDMAEVLAWFVTYNYQGKRRLPQGSSSSPSILNLVYKPMCKEIDRFCQANGIEWSVYVDDFNFAAPSISSELKDALLSIPSQFGFSIKPKKNKDNLGKTIPHLLGLTVADGKLHFSRTQKKKFRGIFYLAVKYQEYPPEVVHGIMRYVHGPAG